MQRALPDGSVSRRSCSLSPRGTASRACWPAAQGHSSLEPKYGYDTYRTKVYLLGRCGYRYSRLPDPVRRDRSRPQGHVGGTGSCIMGGSTGTALAALKIGGRVAFERLTRPKARRLGDVPCSPYAITTEWLTAVLCGTIPGATVT